MAAIPPCGQTLKQHVLRLNYHQVDIWNGAPIPKPNIPSAHKTHCWGTHGDYLRPLWFEGACQPASIEDLRDVQSKDGSDDNDWELPVIATVPAIQTVTVHRYTAMYMELALAPHLANNTYLGDYS